MVISAQQRIEVTDPQNRELMSITVPNRVVPSILASFTTLMSMLSTSGIGMRFFPPLRFPTKAEKKLIMLAAVVAALEEGEI